MASTEWFLLIFQNYAYVIILGMPSAREMCTKKDSKTPNDYVRQTRKRIEDLLSEQENVSRGF
jgi:hypothetical protein